MLQGSRATVSLRETSLYLESKINNLNTLNVLYLVAVEPLSEQGQIVLRIDESLAAAFLFSMGRKHFMWVQNHEQIVVQFR